MITKQQNILEKISSDVATLLKILSLPFL